MVKRAIRLSPVILLFLFGAVFFSGCGKQTAEEAKPIKFGVMNLNEVMQNHPLYEQHLEKKQRLEMLRWQEVQAEAAKQEQSESAAQDLPAVAGELNAKLDLLQTDWQKRIAAAEETLQLELEKKMLEAQAEIDRSYAEKLFNLRLRSVTMQLTPAEAAADQSAVDVINSEKEKLLNVKRNELQQEKNRQLQEMHQSAGKEIEAFHKQGQEKINALQEAAEKSAAQKNAQAMAAAQSTKSEAFATAEKELLQIEARMKFDLQQVVAKIAQKYELDSVFTKVAVNVSALDITTEATNEIAKVK